MAGHATSDPGTAQIDGGYRPAASNKSFTLPTPPDHLTPGDSVDPALPAAPVNSETWDTYRTVRALLALGAAFVAALAALAVTGTAAAATPCGEKVLADWFDNGRIDRLYPLHCYEEAIDAIPDDIRDYADAEEVISRALQSALRGDLAKGGCDPSPDGSTNDCVAGGGNGGGGSGKGGGGSGGDESGGSQVAPEVDTAGPSSVPIPLLVLGGMSLALLAAGGLGYISRRRAQAVPADELGDDDTLL